MTGAAVVNSPHAFQQIRDLFVDKYLSRNPPSHNMKLALQALAVCKAALEIHHGDKKSSKDIYPTMWDKYVSWAKIICAEPDCGMKISEKPDYVNEKLFLTFDAKHVKFYEPGSKTGKKFWKKFGAVKAALINSDNHVVKRTIASMPGGALPSGTDWSLFLTRLIRNLYDEKELKKADAGNDNDGGNTGNDNDEDGNDEDGIGEIGGSAAKKAGPSPYTDLEEKNDTDGNDENEASGRGCGDPDHDDPDNNDEHDEPTAPESFFPPTLLIILTIGVLSDDCDKLLNHPIAEVEESNLAPVPSRAAVRGDALKDQPSPSLSSVASSPSSISSKIERLKAKASYNEAYRDANQQKNELGLKRLKMYEDEIVIKRDEVKARQDEVKARQDEVKARQDEVKLKGLAVLYSDLRQDLKDARENQDEDEVKRIKIEMQDVQKQRRDLMGTA